MVMMPAIEKATERILRISQLDSVSTLNELGSNMVSGYTIFVGAFGTGVLETKSISDM